MDLPGLMDTPVALTLALFGVSDPRQLALHARRPEAEVAAHGGEGGKCRKGRLALFPSEASDISVGIVPAYKFTGLNYLVHNRSRAGVMLAA